MSRTQTRGICQCCGRDQAVLPSGNMSKHGYTVDFGWFQGVCRGERFRPLQIDRSRADETVANIRADVARFESDIEKIESGKLHPRTAEVRTPAGVVSQPWAELTDYDKRVAVDIACIKLKKHIALGSELADRLELLADEVHGTDLRTVSFGGSASIQVGETRLNSKGGRQTVTRLQGLRVYWTDEQGHKSWTGKAAWRKQELVMHVAQSQQQAEDHVQTQLHPKELSQ